MADNNPMTQTQIVISAVYGYEEETQLGVRFSVFPKMHQVLFLRICA